MAHNFVREWREFEHLCELPNLEDLVSYFIENIQFVSIIHPPRASEASEWGSYNFYHGSFSGLTSVRLSPQTPPSVLKLEIPTGNKTHCVPTFRCIQPLSGVYLRHTGILVLMVQILL